MASVLGAGSAALRKVIANPLSKLRRGETDVVSADGVAFSDDAINSIIEGEIIPQLLFASGGNPTVGSLGKARQIDSEEATLFATLPMSKDASDLLEEVDTYLGKGVTVEAIYLELLAPAARKLGRMWEEDECDFIDVTMGLWRLQEVMREIASRSPGKAGAAPGGNCALFAPMPGDQHTFGAIMIEDVFARAGWTTDLIVQPNRRQLLDQVANRSFDLIGLTLSCDCSNAKLSQLISAIRGVSKYPQIKVMIGGRMVSEYPEIVRAVGADAMAHDAGAALDVADSLVAAAQAGSCTG